MRFFLIAVVIISVVLLMADDTNAKKSYSNRKKRSNVANPSISDNKFNDNDAVKYHDKSKHKKRSSIDTMDEEIPNLEGQNRKHMKLRHHKKYNDLEMEQNNEGHIKTENKHKCEKHGKCKKNQDNKAGENINDDYNAGKQNKHSKNYKNMKKSKHEGKKKCGTNQVTVNDVNDDVNVGEHKEKCFKSKKSSDESNSKVNKNIKSNRDGEQLENKSVLEEVESKKRNVRSSDNIDPAEEEVDENVHGNVPEMCVKEVKNDNQDSVDKTCEI